jgi:hypothetical protein
MKFISIAFLIQVSFSAQGQLTTLVHPDVLIGVDSLRAYKNETIGYRIQLGFDTEKNTLDSLRIKFMTLYPKTDAYITFEAPYFNFMVGDFRTEIEAGLMKEKLVGQFPLCVIHRMRIKLPRID